MPMTITARLTKARTELERFQGAGGHKANADRALQECYRQIAIAALDAQSAGERGAVSDFLDEVDRRVGY